MTHDCISPEWLDLSIAVLATSLDAFPTAPARAFALSRVRVEHCFSREPATSDGGPPRAGQGSPQLLQISTGGTSDQGWARHVDASIGATAAHERRRTRAGPGAALPAPRGGRLAVARRRDATRWK